jgi:hypothetical protein
MFLQAMEFFRLAFGTHPAAVLGDGLTAETLAVKTLRCPGCSATRVGCCMIDLSTSAATRAPRENRDNGFWLLAAFVATGGALESSLQQAARLNAVHDLHPLPTLPIVISLLRVGSIW